MFFKKTGIIETEIDLFLDLVVEGALIFKAGVDDYLEKNGQEFDRRIRKITEKEGKADDLRKHIEKQLYIQSLIPEYRGDVLGILENLDNVIDKAKTTLLEFSIERPEIPPELNASYSKLADLSLKAVEELAIAVRSFFRDINSVKDNISKVHYYEKEVDIVAVNLKRKIFSSDLELSHKTHLRYFVLHIEQLSDEAEAVSERLAISTIKRSI